MIKIHSTELRYPVKLTERFEKITECQGYVFSTAPFGYFQSHFSQLRTADICPAIYFSNQQTIYIFLVLFTLMFIYLFFFIAHALYYIIK